MARLKPITVLCAAFVLASCQFFGDLVSPEEQSLAGFSGTVTSAKNHLPVSGVRVELGELADSTDDNGYFSFSEVETGEKRFKLVKEGYVPKTLKVKVKVSGEMGQYILSPVNTPPRILSFYCIPVVTFARESSVDFVFSAEDSASDYPLAGRIVFGPDDTLAISYSGKGQPLIVSHVFPDTGAHRVRLLLWDWEKQPVIADTAVYISSNHTPRIELSRDSAFFTGECGGGIRLVLNDPDSNWMVLRVNWYDSLLIINNLPNRPRIDTVFRHCFTDTGTFPITVSVADDRTATSARTLQVVVVER